MNRIYVAGPMRGYEEFNFPAFEAASSILRAKGWCVLSPAEEDLKEGFDPANPGEITQERYDAWMQRDLEMIRSCDAIYMLKGWQASEGAQRELARARALGLDVLFEDPLDTEMTAYGRLAGGPVAHDDVVDGCPHCKVPSESGEVRVVNEKTGGQKGSKLARFDLIPAKAMWQVAELYGAGAKKYADNNWRKGYNWSLSIAALERHLALFKEGHILDAETGQPHLASVVFHALALLTFTEEHPELDDRWKSPSREALASAGFDQGQA